MTPPTLGEVPGLQANTMAKAPAAAAWAISVLGDFVDGRSVVSRGRGNRSLQDAEADIESEQGGNPEFGVRVMVLAAERLTSAPSIVLVIMTVNSDSVLGWFDGEKLPGEAGYGAPKYRLNISARHKINPLVIT